MNFFQVTKKKHVLDMLWIVLILFIVDEKFSKQVILWLAGVLNFMQKDVIEKFTEKVSLNKKLYKFT